MSDKNLLSDWISEEEAAAAVDKTVRTLRDWRKRREVLGGYTACSEYRAKLIEGAARIDLDGNPAGAVTGGEAAYALAPKPAKTKPTPSTPPAPPPKPKRMSLDDLRRAARQRKGLT
jgi:ProP effector